MLKEYVELDERYYKRYERYKADEELVAKIRNLMPSAHVVTPSRYSCPDCARNVPRMARIADSLPGWTWEVFAESDRAKMEQYEIRRIPTFIVYDEEGGTELGRIVENPISGSLETDLLGIVEHANERAG